MSRMLHRLERGYELLWREGRPADAVAGLPPDFEWIVPSHPEGALRHGPDGVIQFFRELVEPFEDLEVEWELHELAAERVLVLVDMRARGRASAVPVEMHFGQIWTVSGDRFVRMELYLDVDEAIRESGLLTQLAREAIDAFRDEGVEGLLPYLAADVVWEEDPGWPDAQTWHGRDGVRSTFRERLDSIAIVPEVEEVHELPGRTLTLMRWTAKGEGSGAVGVMRPAVVSSFERGLVTRVRFFLDRQRAWEDFRAA
jgi:ketosteroid isomerase-like protein